MKRFLSISIILVSFAFSSYNVGDQISISDQQLTKEVCYAAPGSDLTIGDDFNLFILEDAAQSFGGSINNVRTGSFGDVGATSFFPAKPLGCYGDGGAIFTNNEHFVEKLKSIRVHGQEDTKYDNIRIGINGRMDTIQAAVLLEKLKIFPEEMVKRNQIASQYRKFLSGHFGCQNIPVGYKSAWAQFSLLASNTKERSLCREQLKNFGIPTAVYYNKPLHLQDAFKNARYKEGDFPISESISKRIFSLPMHPYLAVDDVKQISRNDGSFFLVLGDKFQDMNLLNLPHRVAIGLQAKGWT